MVYISIPYIPENNRIDRDFAEKELRALDISDNAKYCAFEAIYNLKPRGVNFEGKSSVEALMLEGALRRLGIPFRQSEESEY